MAKPYSIKLSFVQIQCLAEDDDFDHLYGLTSAGKIWFKRSEDEDWVPIKMRSCLLNLEEISDE